MSQTTDIHGISKASGCLLVQRVVNALCERLQNFQFHTGRHELINIKAGFFKIAKFPNAVGIIDGTQIPIQGTSKDDEHLYVCRKEFHAINVQAVVDHDQAFNQSPRISSFFQMVLKRFYITSVAVVR